MIFNKRLLYKHSSPDYLSNSESGIKRSLCLDEQLAVTEAEENMLLAQALDATKQDLIISETEIAEEDKALQAVKKNFPNLAICTEFEELGELPHLASSLVTDIAQLEAGQSLPIIHLYEPKDHTDTSGSYRLRSMIQFSRGADNSDGERQYSFQIWRPIDFIKAKSGAMPRAVVEKNNLTYAALGKALVDLNDASGQAFISIENLGQQLGQEYRIMTFNQLTDISSSLDKPENDDHSLDEVEEDLDKTIDLSEEVPEHIIEMAESIEGLVNRWTKSGYNVLRTDDSGYVYWNLGDHRHIDERNMNWRRLDEVDKLYHLEMRIDEEGNEHGVKFVQVESNQAFAEEELGENPLQSETIRAQVLELDKKYYPGGIDFWMQNQNMIAINMIGPKGINERQVLITADESVAIGQVKIFGQEQDLANLPALVNQNSDKLTINASLNPRDPNFINSLDQVANILQNSVALDKRNIRRVRKNKVPVYSKSYRENLVSDLLEKLETEEHPDLNFEQDGASLKVFDKKNGREITINLSKSRQESAYNSHVDYSEPGWSSANFTYNPEENIYENISYILDQLEKGVNWPSNLPTEVQQDLSRYPIAALGFYRPGKIITSAENGYRYTNTKGSFDYSIGVNGAHHIAYAKPDSNVWISIADPSNYLINYDGENFENLKKAHLGNMLVYCDYKLRADIEGRVYYLFDEKGNYIQADENGIYQAEDGGGSMKRFKMAATVDDYMETIYQIEFVD